MRPLVYSALMLFLNNTCPFYLVIYTVTISNSLYGGFIIIIRSTTDPISLNDVPYPENYPCVYEGDGDNGLEIYFENEANKQAYLNMSDDHRITLKRDDSADYIAEG